MKLDSNPMQLIGSVIDGDNPAIALADDGSFNSNVHAAWAQILSHQASATHIAECANSVCRIRIDYKENGSSTQSFGTGFVVGDGLIATNQHVADVLYSSSIRSSFAKFPDRSGIIGFGSSDAFGGTTWKMLEAVLVGFPINSPGLNAADWSGERWDIAVFRVDPAATQGRRKLTFAVSGAADGGRTVAAIGFPAEADGASTGSELQRKAFGGASFAVVKRVSPGNYGIFPEHGLFGGRHTCSTLGGSSGSPIIDLSTGQVVAVHNWGGDRTVDADQSNWAVPARRLQSFIDVCNQRIAADGTQPILAGSLNQDSTTPARLRHDPFGVLPDPPDFRDHIYRPALLNLGPAMNLDAMLPARVLNQGDAPSCTGFALAHLMAILLKTPADSDGVSARMAYEMARLHDDIPGRETHGATLRGAIKGFFHNGLAPADKKEWKRRSWSLSLDMADKARSTALGAYYRLSPSITDYHSAIAETGAIIVTARVHAGWIQPKNGVISYQGEKAISAHAFVVVGYDRDGFIVLNSAGPDWSSWEGVKGRAHWSYRDWAENIIDGWVLRPAVSAPGAFGRNSNTAFGSASGKNKGASSFAPRRHDVLGHIIITDENRLVDYGRYASNLKAIEETAKLLERAKGDPKRKYDHLLVFAHSEITSEDVAVRWAAGTKSFFKDNGIYPVNLLCEPDHAKAFGMLINGAAAEAAKRLDPHAPGSRQLLEVLCKRFGSRLYASYLQAVEAAFVRSSKAREAIGLLLTTSWSHGVKVHLAGHLGGAHAIKRIADTLLDDKIAPTAVETVHLLAPNMGCGEHHEGFVTRLSDDREPSGAIGKLYDYVATGQHRSSKLDDSWLEFSESCLAPRAGYAIGRQGVASAFNSHPHRVVVCTDTLSSKPMSQFDCCSHHEVLNAMVRNALGGDPVRQLEAGALANLAFEAPFS